MGCRSVSLKRFMVELAEHHEVTSLAQEPRHNLRNLTGHIPQRRETSTQLGLEVVLCACWTTRKLATVSAEKDG